MFKYFFLSVEEKSFSPLSLSPLLFWKCREIRKTKKLSQLRSSKEKCSHRKKIEGKKYKNFRYQKNADSEFPPTTAPLDVPLSRGLHEHIHQPPRHDHDQSRWHDDLTRNPFQIDDLEPRRRWCLRSYLTVGLRGGFLCCGRVAEAVDAAVPAGVPRLEGRAEDAEGNQKGDKVQ